MRRVLATVGALASVGAAIAIACGGEVFGNPLGYLDDAGVFHSPDGAAIFGPGSACFGYDSAAFADIAISKYCSSDDECVQWLNPHIPSGYAYDARCSQGNTPRNCNFQFVGEQPTINTGAGTDCTPGPEGDAYCTALLNQFLLGDGHSQSGCAHLCKMNFPENNTPYCEPGTDQYKCAPAAPLEGCACDQTPLANLELCVQRGDASHCEAPCTPPPDTATPPPDAGADQ